MFSTTHIPYLVAMLDGIPGIHVFHYTHTITYYILLLWLMVSQVYTLSTTHIPYLVAMVDGIPGIHVFHYTHTISCCYA